MAMPIPHSRDRLVKTIFIHRGGKFNLLVGESR